MNGPLTDHKSLVSDPPQKNWRVFPSYDIPSLFNYGHVYHYAYAYAGRVAVHEPSLSLEKCQETATKSVVFFGCIVSHGFWRKSSNFSIWNYWMLKLGSNKMLALLTKAKPGFKLQDSFDRTLRRLP